MRARTLWLSCSAGAVVIAVTLTSMNWSADAKRMAAPHVEETPPITGKVEQGRSLAPTMSSDSSRKDLKAGKNTANQSTQGEDYSYVGVPFPVSASIQPGCAKWDLCLGSCTAAFNRLATMKDEPRDLDWAPKMEQKIQDEIVSEGGGGFGVRNVECRRTICALEVISRLSPPWGAYSTPPLEFLNPNKLFSNVCGYSPSETDESGVKTTVTLVVYRRVGAL